MNMRSSFSATAESILLKLGHSVVLNNCNHSLEYQEDRRSRADGRGCQSLRNPLPHICGR